MCYFLTIAVPADYADRSFQAFGRGFDLHQTANPTVVSAMPSAYALRVLTSGMCSCDLYAPPGTIERGDESDHLRRKYANRGWNEAKIGRAIEESKKGKTQVAAMPGLRSDVIERLQEICEAAGALALVMHWYHGDVESERLSIVRTRGCNCRDLRSCGASLREDELLRVSAAS